MQLIHHGGHEGVTGSCHQLKFANGKSTLIDCGLFQGEDARRHPDLEIEFPLTGIESLILTHVHIDHVGRLPYLMAAGFDGPIFCSQPTAKLLPLTIEDALKIGFTRNKRMIDAFCDKVGELLRPVDYGKWTDIPGGARIRIHPAGHILGSTWVEVEVDGRRAVFSGDLGAPHAPLRKDVQSPEGADLLVLESTYGDKLHEDRTQRRERLKAVLRRTLQDKGVTIIPAFSLGRTQELLYEMNGIFEQLQTESGKSLLKYVDVIVDSPLASKFTEVYDLLQPYWDAEAQQILRTGDQPLVFDNLYQIDEHEEHQDTIAYLQQSGIGAVVIAGSGMWTGGRVVNYLKAFLDKPTTDVVFVGYQGAGTPGRDIQAGRDRVELDGREHRNNAKVHRLGGYSAHADQQNLLDFVSGMSEPPGEIVLVHGERDAKAVLRSKLESAGYQVR